jgi:hypothetical protein
MRLAEQEPTMEEIVGALRETRQRAGRVPPFAVVGGQPAEGRASGSVLRGGEGGAAVDARSGTVGSTDIADLRDNEIERLLAENARLNERVMFLLKVIEREQARNANIAAEHAARETDRSTIFRDLRTALEAEVRPVLLAMLQLLEKQRADPAGEGARRAGHEVARATLPKAAPYDDDGIVDLDAQCL